MKGLRIGLCGMLVFSVLSLGAVQVWSQSVLEMLSGILLIAWALVASRNAEGAIHWSPLNWPLLGLIGIGLFELLFHQTAYAFLTRTELLKLAAYCIFFFLLAQAFRKESDLRTLAWFLMIFCFTISLLGIIQHFTSEQEMYWLPSIHVNGDSFGPYVNRNHFAGFVELTLPVGLALLVFRGFRRDSFPLITLLTIVPISALILAGSRGGISSFAIEIVVLGFLARKNRALSGIRVATIAAIAIVAMALVAWIGAETAIQRFSMLEAHDVSLSRRISMARGAIHIFMDHPIEGTGLGTVVSVYPRYETAYDGKVVDHVHNDYAELLAETGVLGGLCGLAFLVLLYQRARQNLAQKQSGLALGLHSGAAVAVIGLLFHSFVDFNLHIPSNALLFLVQAHILSTAMQPEGGSLDIERVRGRHSSRIAMPADGTLNPASRIRRELFLTAVGRRRPDSNCANLRAIHEKVPGVIYHRSNC